MFSSTGAVRNITIGHESSQSNTGADNVAIGWRALRTLVATNSIFIGSGTNPNATSETNQIVIGHNQTGLGSNTVVLGNSSVVTTVLRGNVGIGITTPVASLDILAPTSTTGLNLTGATLTPAT